ncbi:MAG: class I SAM-dependent methyltransferase [SAR202 cluster bacterium]|jgi:ubiquinone/menaquinone biosynthesis C-methylase UbiE|nr:class I SAM-dependent methyltransferase [SAR202 cluster bacterium]MDP6715710.1 class I SAM-dependent methyltransferase [SAR202 cluster bacterium]
MSTAFCPSGRNFFCSQCASDVQQEPGEFWAWQYHFNLRSPWSGQWVATLDRAEFDGEHPISIDGERAATRLAISKEEYIVRYPEKRTLWRPEHEVDDDDVRASWNTNAERWDSLYDDDGDRNRRYQSDEPMLALLGEVGALNVLDVGCGNGYLSRKLANPGAKMTGVEIASGMLDIATDRERREPLGITYHHGSASEMDFLGDSTFDKAVSNYVLMDIRDYTGALAHVFRVLKAGGHFVAVFSHPCFASGPAGWVVPAPDTPRREERFAYRVDTYFHRGPYYGVWGNLDPVLSFHRPLRDYWRAFEEAGFVVDGFDEPSIAERGMRELPPWGVQEALRIPFSCIFRLRKP